ncbi:metal ABC transporter solute-binding protein, Zn/Mn family [Paenibacillus mendelii]|uniref:Metal ABC transporter solute-binding protein, Zn/Mn family n=1 Tax=Paenibacillus mendelii TaxID=206163 RepID=A0ABV6JMP1_9BACL|nr:zinc ABC transporter substrate-binding protein [Paenibacillus mendelii]MCQ6558734.1 zinc ABC transporter substrate-binding protein [Paenibacillus mendelii]
MRSKTNSAIRRWFMTVLFLAVTTVVISACGDDKAASGSGKLQVTATTGMIADVVNNIGGDQVEAIGLMGPGVDPHLYKATQGDIKKLDNADIIFYNGLHLEGKMGEMFEKLEKKKATVAVSKAIPSSELLSNPTASDAPDPHIWFNVRNWISAAEVIRDTLVEKDPAHADSYKTRASEYIAKLEELDAYAKEQIATIPEPVRVLVTAHDAFGYFGKAYNIKVMGLQGISTASEYGSKDVSNLRDYLVENKIKAVFVESSVPKKSIEAVIEGAGKMGHEVVIGGELFSDAMGKNGTEEGTYIGMVKHNVDTIVNALK